MSDKVTEKPAESVAWQADLEPLVEEREGWRYWLKVTLILIVFIVYHFFFN